MKRKIIGFHQDEHHDWVAELDCGHNQHMRHKPPFMLRPWVLTTNGRNSKIGESIECRLCDSPK